MSNINSKVHNSQNNIQKCDNSKEKGNSENIFIKVLDKSDVWLSDIT